MKPYCTSWLFILLMVSRPGICQWSSDPSLNPQKNGNYIMADDSFEVNPDTLWFLTPEEVWTGKEFHIINPHDYPLDIQYIQTMGSYPPEYIPWFTDPWSFTFPVNIAAGDSLGIIVKWPVIDQQVMMTIVYDTLHINTANTYGQVIIAADSSLIIWVGAGHTRTFGFRLFPNPFRDKICLDMDIKNDIQAQIKIFDMLMKPVCSLFDGKLNKGNHKITWNGTDSNNNELAPGVYVIVVITQDGRDSYRVIKI